VNPILRTAFRAHAFHNFTGRAPRLAANDCPATGKGPDRLASAASGPAVSRSFHG